MSVVHPGRGIVSLSGAVNTTVLSSTELLLRVSAPALTLDGFQPPETPALGGSVPLF